MADKALTVHLRNSSPLKICPHYGPKQTELGDRTIHHLPFPLVHPGLSFGQITQKGKSTE